MTRQLDARGVEDRNRWAYPVGDLRPSDLRKLPVTGWKSSRCAMTLSIENKSRALQQFSAAARVAFASTGVLLAENVDHDLVATPQTEWQSTRYRLLSNEVSWSQVLRERDLRLRPDLLKPWLRWINTATQLHRFDTTYFLAAVPFGQDVDFLSSNESSGGWKRPEEILADARTTPTGSVRALGSSSRACSPCPPSVLRWPRSATSTRCVRRSSTRTDSGASSSIPAATSTGRARCATAMWPWAMTKRTIAPLMSLGVDDDDDAVDEDTDDS